MGSYQKLAKLKEETVFELKTLKRWIEKKENDPDYQEIAFIMEKGLNNLFKLYEIK